jgi:hypothetical protein
MKVAELGSREHDVITELVENQAYLTYEGLREREGKKRE